ncbi:MAG TPA: FG-GAP-like repeat-containing protein, partial [Thermoanaerobaculia bacterium]
SVTTTPSARVYAVDFLGTGKPDVVLTQGSGASTYVNDGNGNFTYSTFINANAAKWRVAAGDYDHDGQLDLLLPNRLTNVLQKTNYGGFSSNTGFSSWVGAAPGDFNGDGHVDFVIVSSTANRAVVFLNTCPKFATRITISPSANPVPYHGSLTLTAVVSPTRDDGPTPTGTVLFQLLSREEGFVQLTPGPGNTATASFTWTNLEFGTYTARAVYYGTAGSGDAIYYGSLFTSMTINVLRPPFGAPTLFVADHLAAQSMLRWMGSQGVDHYEIWRMKGGVWSLIGTTSNESFVDPNVTQGVTYAYKVRGVAPDGTFTPFSIVDLAGYFTFQQTPGGNFIWARFVEDGRAAINQLRVTAGLAPKTTWTDPNVYELPVKAIHVNEMRNALDEARAVIGLAPLQYQPVIAGVTAIRRNHFLQLHSGALRGPDIYAGAP